MKQTNWDSTILKAGGFILLLLSLHRVSKIIVLLSSMWVNLSLIEYSEIEMEASDVYFEILAQCGGILLSAIFLLVAALWMMRQPKFLRRLIAS